MSSPGLGVFPWGLYVFVVLGVLISVLLPILRALLPKPPASPTSDPPAWQRAIATGMFSLLTAVIILAISKNQTPNWSWQDAIVAGFAWDSLLQRVAIG